ncbi:hypothetical protein AAG906_026988 [Vitis piasezkii]
MTPSSASSPSPKRVSMGPNDRWSQQSKPHPAVSACLGQDIRGSSLFSVYDSLINSLERVGAAELKGRG